jgi:hypothetical protein
LKIENISITTLVHSLACLTLLGTIALFGYEVTKPAVTLAAPITQALKSSPLSAPADAEARLHRLPTLSERFQRKILYYGARRKAWAPGKYFTPRPANGKVYSASAARSSADDE